MERLARRVEILYVWTFAMATLHEIDSAYWHEWEVLGLPGGIDLFLIENLILCVPFLLGLSRLTQTNRSGPLFGIVLAGFGIAGFGLHAYLLVRGGTAFCSTVSISILISMFVLSTGLMFESLRLKRREI